MKSKGWDKCMHKSIANNNGSKILLRWLKRKIMKNNTRRNLEYKKNSTRPTKNVKHLPKNCVESRTKSKMNRPR